MNGVSGKKWKNKLVQYALLGFKKKLKKFSDSYNSLTLFHRSYNLNAVGYEEALLDCSKQQGQNLIQISQLARAIKAFESSILNTGIRIDALSNKSCFVDQQGVAVDPVDHGFNVSIARPEQVGEYCEPQKSRTIFV